jgi:GT2 family glycosyltransferase
MRCVFIVATKDRPRELGRLLGSLEAQSRPPDEVVVVDGGREPAAAVCRGVKAFPVRLIRSAVPSAASQRNLGLESLGSGEGFAGFFDDDVVLEASALASMFRFWEGADAQVGGAAFSMRNHPTTAWPSLKLSPFTEAAGLYSRRPGAVSQAGFQTMIGRPRETVFTDWLPSGASLWRRDVFRWFRFDEWFEGYSYLEDLDFSYRVGKAYRLAVVAGAGYYHFPAASGRGGGREFGMREVLNRVHFVRKNAELSLPRCYLALAVRLMMNLGFAAGDAGHAYYLQRAWGNALGLARSLGRM